MASELYVVVARRGLSQVLLVGAFDDPADANSVLDACRAAPRATVGYEQVRFEILTCAHVTSVADESEAAVASIRRALALDGLKEP